MEGGKTPDASFVLGVQLNKMHSRAERIALGKQLLRDAGALPTK